MFKSVTVYQIVTLTLLETNESIRGHEKTKYFGVFYNQIVIYNGNQKLESNMKYKFKTEPYEHQLEALKNQVAAQLDKKISPEAASTVTDYANSVIMYLESQMPVGEGC